MADRKRRAAAARRVPGGPVSPSWTESLRWLLLLAAVLVLIAFLLAQYQSANVTYGDAPGSGRPIAEGGAGELSGATVPSVAEMTARLKRSPVVRLPGSIATWDENRVRAAAHGTDIRILVAPPGLPEAAQRQVDQVGQEEKGTVRVIGLQVTGSIYQVSPDRAAEWMDNFATGDVTDEVLTMIAEINDQPTPPDVPPQPRRDPSPAELGRVTAALRAHGSYVAPGATLRDVPTSTRAFGGRHALYVALPRQSSRGALVHFGPSLAREFPGRPIVVLYGQWIEYDGPFAEKFADVATASFYGQFHDRLSTYAYPQGNVLYAYLNRVTTIRYAGLFDRPVPYVPIDPVRVALPALPWIFAACAVGFLVLSARTVLRPPRRGVRAGARGRTGAPARLAGLTTLALEISNLAGESASAPLARAISGLGAAREAIDERLPDAHVRRLLDTAESELDATARQAGWPDYRPRTYFQWRLG